MILLDTSALLAHFWAGDANHARVVRAMASEHGPFVVSPYVVAELDYLLLRQGGVRMELVALGDLASGAYELPVLAAADLLACTSVIARYRDHGIGVTDASLVVLAQRYETNRICTLDRRHFSVLRTLDGNPFELLP